MIEIDTKIRHVTKAGANLFLDLGLEPEEAERCHIESRKHISQLLSIKHDLITELNNWIDEKQLPQEEAARICNYSAHTCMTVLQHWIPAFAGMTNRSKQFPP